MSHHNYYVLQHIYIMVESFCYPRRDSLQRCVTQVGLSRCMLWLVSVVGLSRFGHQCSRYNVIQMKEETKNVTKTQSHDRK